MRKFNLRQVVGRLCFLTALGLTTLVASTPAAVGQTVLINPALEGGFEFGPSFAANGWTVANGSGVTNQWYVGTVPSGFTNNSAYISGDAGVTNGYGNTAASVVHFYRDVTFPAGETAIALTFNWKANGEAGFYDALIVSIAPTSHTPAATSTSLGLATVPAPAVELGRFWLQTTTQSATIAIPSSLAGNCTANSTMRLIFTWKNDGSAGTAPSAAVDNIQLLSNLNSITSAGGTFTIDNTLPLSATNFPSFSTAIAALNAAGGCGFLNPVTFNVTAGQTFNELPPAITASGSAIAPITFQKSGAGANPIISSTGTAATNDASLAIVGGDYFTFDGIDINNTASLATEYGYLVRNFSATDGAKNIIIRNASIQMSRAVTTSTSAAILTSATSTGGGVTATSAAGSNDNIQLRNITVNGAINGISMLGTAAFPDLNNVIGVIGSYRNTITNIGPVGPTGVVARGINLSAQSGSSVQNTDISNVTSHTANAQGIFVTGCLGNTIINGNSIYAISNQGSTTTTSVAYGIQAQNSTTGTNNIRISNNMIGNIFTSFTSTATATRYAIGIQTGAAGASSSQSYDVYHNTVSIGNGLTPTYSNTCYEIQNVSAVYRVQNNLFANFTGAQGATARHYAWVTTSATSIGAAGSVSNYNDLYIATDGGTSGFVARANTNNLATVANWTAAITAYPGTDQNSFNSAPIFVNNNSNLHLNMGVTATQIESAGNNALGIAVDFDGENRPGPTGSVNGGATAPDIGADEFDGVPLPPPSITLNSVTPATTTQCTASSRLVSVNVVNTAGSLTSVVLNYNVNGVAQTPISMTNTSGTTWEATIPVPTPVNATITWNIVATNSLAASTTYTGSSYSDEPLFGYTATATASNTTVCSGNNSILSASISSPGNPTYTAPTAVTNPTTDEDLRQIIISQGATVLLNNTSTLNTLDGTIGTPTGTAGSYSNYTASQVTDLVAGQTYNYFMTSIDGAPTYYANNGAGYIDFNRDGDFFDAGEQIFNGSMLNKTVDNGIDSIIGTFTVPANAVNGLVRMRLIVNEGAITGPTMTVGYGEFEEYAVRIQNITSVTWMDGATTVGTGNPLTVNPTTTTTYTANITASGCTISPAPTVTVTVNPLPTAPTASNSTQCGTQIPTASVASTSGLPTPTFNWYAAASGGSALQSSTSTTYTSNVASTTTFYVSELNTTTGCESARTAVTVTVATADGISASASATTICIGNSVTLTAANTNPTPVQNYTYTWSGLANSGANPSVNGASVTVTPTQPGTYQYDLSGVDGGCNAVANVTVTVDPFAATLAPVNITCNGYNNGSFSLTGSSCGTTPYSYSVDGGAFGAIPTNLTPGVHTVVVKDANGYLASSQNITITEPSTTISIPTATNTSVCQGGTSATVTAASTTNAPGAGSVTLVVPFDVLSQPTETNAAPGNVIASATYSLPAGSTVTSATLNYNGIQATGGSWESDVRLGLSGAIVDAAAAGTGALGSAGTFNYTRTIPNGSVSIAGGTVNLLYWDFFNDNAGSESTFPTGTGVANLTIVYTPPAPATISWWDAASGGTQIGTGSPFETVGTSVLPNTNTPGTYTVYAQADYSGCSNQTRTPATITVNATSASTTTIVACGSYLWTNGTTYTTSGTYTQTLTNSVGCDSIATLNLTINQPTSHTITQAACGSYTWTQNGTTYTTSGSYSVTLAGANSVGCDSTITLNLTINQPTTSTITQSACGSYFWADNGTTYTTSGTYTTTLAGANNNGCDSTITLNLTINQPTTSTIAQSACGSYTWADNGQTYTTSGTYTATLAGANANGCDSTITLNLTINQPTTSTISQSACGSYFWADNGQTYTTSGTYTATLAGANSVGCDSTITLNLTINQPTSSSIPASACGSYLWAENGQTYTTSGSYSVTLAGANSVGCDSTVTLILTINQPTSSSTSASACESYFWAENGQTYTASGSYSVTLAGANANGCDSTVTLNLTITGLPTATATDNGDATITASAGSSYQWIDCATGLAIAGATSQTYTATANGDYAVVVTNADGCSDTSTCVTIDYIGLKEIADASIRVFPNPTNNDVFVTMSATEATVEVSDAQGKVLQTLVVKNGEKVSLGTYETGVYFLRIRTANGSTLERIVKQ